MGGEAHYVHFDESRFVDLSTSRRHIHTGMKDIHVHGHTSISTDIDNTYFNIRLYISIRTSKTIPAYIYIHVWRHFLSVQVSLASYVFLSLYICLSLFSFPYFKEKKCQAKRSKVINDY